MRGREPVHRTAQRSEPDMTRSATPSWSHAERHGRARIAVVGGGVSGLLAAWRLQDIADVHLIEAAPRVGGHVNTVDVEEDGCPIAVDTGFIVFSRAHYPVFCGLLDELQVATHASCMSFSVDCESDGVIWNGTTLNGLFAQRRNLARPRFLAMARDMLRFHRVATREREGLDDSESVDAFLRRHRFCTAFRDWFLVPMGSALWSCPRGRFGAFPIRFVVDFLHHHQMLQVHGRPVWRVVTGGSRTYVDRLLARFRGTVHRATPVTRVVRRSSTGGGPRIITASGDRVDFDHVILAVHADEALRLIDRPTDREREILGAFEWETNDAILHTDDSVMPRIRRAWASWNAYLPAVDSTRASITYNMNILQRLAARRTYLVTLNDTGRIRESAILAQFRYRHPVFTHRRSAAQAAHEELIDRDGLSCCGAWWGYGFHEDGARSGAFVADRLRRRLSGERAPGDGDPPSGRMKVDGTAVGIR